MNNPWKLDLDINLFIKGLCKNRTSNPTWERLIGELNFCDYLYLFHNLFEGLRLPRSVFLNRRVATQFWVAGTYFWVAKTCVKVNGSLKVFYSVLWVANYQTLRTTDLDNHNNRFICFKCKYELFIVIRSTCS